jgi:hypothetical protein
MLIGSAEKAGTCLPFLFLPYSVYKIPAFPHVSPAWLDYLTLKIFYSV